MIKIEHDGFYGNVEDIVGEILGIDPEDVDEDTLVFPDYSSAKEMYDKIRTSSPIDNWGEVAKESDDTVLFWSGAYLSVSAVEEEAC